MLFSNLFRILQLSIPDVVFGYALPPCCSPADSFQWCGRTLDDILEHRIVTNEYYIQLLTNRTINSSTAFSGVGGPEVGDTQIENTLRAKLDRLKQQGQAMQRLLANREPLRFVPMWAIESNTKCWEELLSLPNPPLHIFTDIREFVPRHLRKSVGLDGGQELPSTELRKTLPFCKPLLRGWCVVCGSNCYLTHTALHTAGSPCTDHSSMGNQQRMQGQQAGRFLKSLCHKKS